MSSSTFLRNLSRAAAQDTGPGQTHSTHMRGHVYTHEGHTWSEPASHGSKNPCMRAHLSSHNPHNVDRDPRMRTNTGSATHAWELQKHTHTRISRATGPRPGLGTCGGNLATGPPSQSSRRIRQCKAARDGVPERGPHPVALWTACPPPRGHLPRLSAFL